MMLLNKDGKGSYNDDMTLDQIRQFGKKHKLPKKYHLQIPREISLSKIL